MTTDDTRWRTVAVSYHDEPGTPDLILDGVRPLFDELPFDAYFLRHWRRGPHVRLNIRVGLDRLIDTVLPAAQRWIGGFLAARPSTSTVDLERLLPTHRVLARAELDDGPLWPPRPDNHVAVEAYESRAHAVGGPAAAEFVAAFHVAATPAAFAAAEAIRADGQRLWAAFELMAATADACSGVARGAASFRTHAEVFLARSLARHQVRADWDQVYRLARPALVARLDRAIRREPPSDRWLAALASVRDRGFDLVDRGRLRVDLADTEPDGVGGAGGVRDVDGTTPFLSALLADADFRDRVLPSPEFRHDRLLVNLLFLQLAKLGIRPAERALLGHLLANTVEDGYGLDAVAALTRSDTGP